MITFIQNYFRRTFVSLNVYNYRLYMIGQLVSMSGNWMQTIALGWLVVEITGSGTQLGVVMALQFVPMLLGGAWGGLIIDRFPTRTVMYYAQAAIVMLSVGMGALIFFDAVTITTLYAFALLFGCVRIFDDTARHSFVIELVGGGLLKNAVSLSATVMNLSRALGPMLAGILIAGIGIEFCFYANALTYVVGIYTLSRMRADELQAPPLSTRMKGQIKEGLRYVWGNPVIRRTLLMMAVIGTFTYEFHVSLPLIAEGTFMGTAGSYAALMSAMGIGAVFGGLVAAARHSVSSAQLVIAVLSFGVVIVLTSVMPTLALAVIGMFAVGFFAIQVTSLANTTIQLEAAPEMRGRVMALWTIAMMGSTPIGGPIIGIIGEFVGPRWGLAVGGIAALLAGSFAGVRLLQRTLAQPVPESIEIETDITVATADT